MKNQTIAFSPEPLDNKRLANLCGALDANIRQIAETLEVKIGRRANKFSIQGDPVKAERARQALDRFYQQASDPLNSEDIQLELIDLTHSPAQAENDAGGAKSARDASDESPTLHTRRTDLQGRTPKQREYLRNIVSHDVTIGIGPAGTGKTYLAVACAVDALERESVKRIVLTRPAVEAGERLGFLPGDLAQKVDPYLRPLYDALYDLMGVEKTQRMFEKQVIEIAPLAYMRGRTLNHAFIILDEAQNTTPEQMKMFLTRLGFGSRAVVTGDTSQIDLPRGQPSGLIQACRILQSVPGIAQTEFSSRDVVRHPLVARIVDAYAREETGLRERG
ncbi:MAG: PhoH family protein [Burkholderiaceae bacterium]